MSTAEATVRSTRLPAPAASYSTLFTFLVLPAIAAVGLHLFPTLDLIFHSARFHVGVVSGIAACALAVAVLASRAAVQSSRLSLVLLAVGCLWVGVFMLAHGLTTPGFAGRPMNVWIGRHPMIAITGFAFLLAAAGRNHVERPMSRGRARELTLAVIAGLSLPVAGTVLWPTAFPGSRPFPYEPTVRNVVAVAAGLVLVHTGRRHWERWRLGGDRVQLSLMLAAWLSAAALVSLELGVLWRLSWWDYHLYLLAGFGAAVFAIVSRYRELSEIQGVLENAFSDDPLEHIEHGYPEALHALVAAVETRDEYTHGHSVRVATLAVRLGLRLGLKPEQLRTLAQGAFLHDIGKLGVPDSILNKEGPLDEAERRWIEQHPILGYDLVRQSPSLHAALATIRHHHERWDGSGYPDGLAGTDIPLSARLVAVVDVWDALTTDRAYRPAWELQRALAHLLAGRGGQFDPDMVDALAAHLAERGIVAHAGTGDAHVAEAALSSCHGERGLRAHAH